MFLQQNILRKIPQFLGEISDFVLSKIGQQILYFGKL